MPGDGVPSSPAPTTSGTPAPVSTAPPASEPAGVLRTVGLTPLARGDGTDDERYALKVLLKPSLAYVGSVHQKQSLQSIPSQASKVMTSGILTVHLGVRRSHIPMVLRLA